MFCLGKMQIIIFMQKLFSILCLLLMCLDMIYNIFCFFFNIY